MKKLLKIRVSGMVQGVGFRPFVAGAAEELSLCGQVKNVGGRVEIMAAGEERAMEEFLRRLRFASPKGADVRSVETEELSPDTPLPEDFSIVESGAGSEELRLLPPDLATCPDCERELFDPEDRRYLHPFISCASCGPRYSILRRVPYDRKTVTMDRFPLCASCAKEYRRQGDRRRHAQTICCKSCGPELHGIGIETEATGEEAFSAAVRVIRSRGIVAVKDIGGFHFVFLPEEGPAERLRRFKAREGKPFALCFPDLESVRTYCAVSKAEEALLTGSARPIVLLEKKKDLPDAVLRGSSRIGAMLPCNPIQILLTRELGPLVMTSGNRGNEPILIHTEEMKKLLLSGCPDYILTHEREILSPLDDSIYQVTELADGRTVTQILRRARGIVPEPVLLNQELRNEILAAGSDLKAVFALGKGRAAYLSPHFGDLTEVSCVKARERELNRMQTLFEVTPKETVGDLHPAYVSAQHATLRVQHHHAHILSVMAEHDLKGPLLGLAFDGTGYGSDGMIWGSEFLLCHGAEFEKKGSLLPVPLIGGDLAARDATLPLTSYLFSAGVPYGDPTVLAALAAGVNVVKSSSMGRLFDAAAALLNVCTTNSYEGECAARLEILAEHAGAAYPLTLPRVEQEGCSYGDGAALLIEMKRAQEGGADAAALARGFHTAVAEFAVETAAKIATECGIDTIALSGGTFCNRILLKQIIPALCSRGYRVYWNERVPCGDGGLALGQVYYCALRGGEIICA